MTGLDRKLSVSVSAEGGTNRQNVTMTLLTYGGAGFLRGRHHHIRIINPQPTKQA